MAITYEEAERRLYALPFVPMECWCNGQLVIGRQFPVELLDEETNRALAKPILDHLRKSKLGKGALMMKLEDTRAAHDTFTAKASDISRQLGLAALAIVWIFKADKSMSVPHALALPALLAICALTSDLLQYVYASIAWGQFNRRSEIREHLNEDADFDAPRAINWPTNVFFYLKITLIISCYACLLTFIGKTIAH